MDPTSDTTDPAAAAIEAYVEATGTGQGTEGFPVVLAVGFLVIAAVLLVVAWQLRRRYS
jgi:hypothetical protein